MCRNIVIFKMILLFSFVLLGESIAQINNYNPKSKGFTIMASGGYLISSFEDQESSANSFSISLSGLFNFSPKFLLGGFIETSLKPFEFQDVVGEEEIWHFNEKNVLQSKSYNDLESSRKISQAVVGAKAIYLFSQHSLKPFIGGGAGLYLGSMEQNAVDRLGGEKTNFKSALAFHLSGGLLYRNRNLGFFIGLNYHIVSRALDKGDEVTYETSTYRDPTTANISKIVAIGGLPPGGDSKSFNNYGILAGIIIDL